MSQAGSIDWKWQPWLASTLKNQLFRASLIKHITDSRSSCQKNCFMVLLLGLKMWWYFCLKSVNAWHSKMTWYSSPMQFSWHLLQKRRERGTPKRSVRKKASLHHTWSTATPCTSLTFKYWQLTYASWVGRPFYSASRLWPIVVLRPLLLVVCVAR